MCRMSLRSEQPAALAQHASGGNEGPPTRLCAALSADEVVAVKCAMSSAGVQGCRRAARLQCAIRAISR
jgi:hypothetical protein